MHLMAAVPWPPEEYVPPDEEEERGSLEELIAVLRQTVAILDEGESEGE